jgi:hypothetical protein
MKDALPIGHTYVWENIRSRILATEVSFQYKKWDPGAWIIVAEILKFSTTRTSDTSRPIQKLGILTEDIISMKHNEQLLFQDMQLATQIWDPGITSLVDEAIADTSFELKVKFSMLMFWPLDHDVWSIISEVATKLIIHGATETFSQLCNMLTHDGMPWDPGGISGSGIQAIAWGQAMFCPGGSVTPDVSLGCIPLGRNLSEVLMQEGLAQPLEPGD